MQKLRGPLGYVGRHTDTPTFTWLHIHVYPYMPTPICTFSHMPTRTSATIQTPMPIYMWLQDLKRYRHIPHNLPILHIHTYLHTCLPVYTPAAVCEDTHTHVHVTIRHKGTHTKHTLAHGHAHRYTDLEVLSPPYKLTETHAPPLTYTLPETHTHTHTHTHIHVLTCL